MISISEFSNETFVSFGRGMQTNLITLDGQDIYALLEKKIPLVDGLRKKRWAAETGKINKKFYELY